MYCRSGRVPMPVQPRRWLIVSFIWTWRFSPLVPLRFCNFKSYSRDETSHMRGKVCYRCRDLSIRPSYRRASQKQSIPQLQDRPTNMWQIISASSICTQKLCLPVFTRHLTSHSPLLDSLQPRSSTPLGSLMTRPSNNGLSP